MILLLFVWAAVVGGGRLCVRVLCIFRSVWYDCINMLTHFMHVFRGVHCKALGSAGADSVFL